MRSTGSTVYTSRAPRAPPRAPPSTPPRGRGVSPPRPDAVSRLDDVHVEDAARILTRAFFDYPMWTWILPDEAHRRRALPAVLRASVGWGLLLGEGFG